MAYFWLNQKESDMSSYEDEVGKVYHYRGGTPGAQQLSEGDKFVYYRPGDYMLSGAGEIERIEVEPDPDNSEHTADYYAYIQNYRAFEPPVVLKGIGETDLKDQLSFLRDRPGLTGVPQHSICEIERDDFMQILDTADVEALD